MSYILDALKKSERERQRGSVPDVHTPENVPRQTRKQRLLPYLILCVLILNAGLLVGWLIGSPKKPQSMAQSAVSSPVRAKAHESAKGIDVARASVETPPAEPVKTSSLARTAEKRPAVGTPAAGAETHAQIVRRDQPLKAGAEQKTGSGEGPLASTTAKETPQSAPPAPQQVAVNHAPVEPQPVTHNETPIKNKIYSLKELPSSVQQKLPDFSISILLYSSENASRMVRINGQMLREGQYLSAGIKLEEIVPDGVILSFQNYRFHVVPR